MKSILVSLLLFTGLQANADVLRDVSQYNLKEGGLSALVNYDPVSFRLGDKGVTGTDELSLDHEGVIYKFANQENLDEFLTKPTTYEPTYGGWCAYAMALGSKVDINPKHFIVVGDRTHFFVNSRAKRNFSKDIEKFEAQADVNWEEISGETPPSNEI